MAKNFLATFAKFKVCFLNFLNKAKKYFKIGDEKCRLKKQRFDGDMVSTNGQSSVKKPHLKKPQVNNFHFKVVNITHQKVGKI